MKTFNQVILLGHLGRDAETKFTAGGDARTTFSMATNRRVKDGDAWRDETDWHNCVLWKQEGVVQYLTKGKSVHVVGRLQTRSWETKEGEKRYSTEVVISDLVLLGGGEQGEQAALVSAPRGPKAVAGSALSSLEVTDDDVPF